MKRQGGTLNAYDSMKKPTGKGTGMDALETSVFTRGQAEGGTNRQSTEDDNTLYDTIMVATFVQNHGMCIFESETQCQLRTLGDNAGSAEAQRW